ncbi:MAG: HAD hydrolase-like protein [Nanoarchaeota archaeon]
MSIQLILVSDRALLETRPEYRYAIINQALRSFTMRFTDQTALDEFWWTSEPERILKEKLHVTDPTVFWKSYNRQETAEFRKQLTKPYSDVAELDALRKKKIHIILLAHDHKELAQVSMEKLPKINDVICVPRDTLNYGKKIEEAIQNMLKMHAVKPTEVLLISNMKEDLEGAKKNKVSFVYLARKASPTLKEKNKIDSLDQIKRFL